MMNTAAAADTTMNESDIYVDSSNFEYDDSEVEYGHHHGETQVENGTRFEGENRINKTTYGSPIVLKDIINKNNNNNNNNNVTQTSSFISEGIKKQNISSSTSEFDKSDSIEMPVRNLEESMMNDIEYMNDDANSRALVPCYGELQPYRYYTTVPTTNTTTNTTNSYNKQSRNNVSGEGGNINTKHKSYNRTDDAYHRSSNRNQPTEGNYKKMQRPQQSQKQKEEHRQQPVEIRQKKSHKELQQEQLKEVIRSSSEAVKASKDAAKAFTKLMALKAKRIQDKSTQGLHDLQSKSVKGLQGLQSHTKQGLKDLKTCVKKYDKPKSRTTEIPVADEENSIVDHDHREHNYYQNSGSLRSIPLVISPNTNGRNNGNHRNNNENSPSKTIQSSLTSGSRDHQERERHSQQRHHQETSPSKTIQSSVTGDHFSGSSGSRQMLDEKELKARKIRWYISIFALSIVTILLIMMMAIVLKAQRGNGNGDTSVGQGNKNDGFPVPPGGTTVVDPSSNNNGSDIDGQHGTDLAPGYPAMNPTKAPASSPTDSPTSSPTYGSITSVLMTLNMVQQELTLFLLEISPDSEGAFLTPGSPQFKAMEWLSKDPRSFRRYSSQEVVQRWVLATFYYSTLGETSWRRTDGWLQYGISECDWWKVTCHDFNVDNIVVANTQGEGTPVQKITLNGNSLEGSLPPELSLLTDLEILPLEHNRIGGTLPTEFGLLTKLEHLEFKVNRLEGTIPTELGNLDNLEFLSFRRNKIEGTLPTELARLTEIRTFDLAINSITGSIPPEYGQGFEKIELLDLSTNDLTGTIPDELAQLIGEKLNEVRFHANDFTGTMPIEFCELTNDATTNETILSANCDDVECDCCTECCNNRGRCTSNVNP